MRASAKYLHTVSNLNIVCAAVAVILNAASLVALYSRAGELMREPDGDRTFTVTLAALVILLAAGVIGFVLGALGLRMAHSAKYLGPCLVISVVDVLLVFAAAIVTAIIRSFRWICILQLIFPALMFLAADAFRKRHCD